MKIKKRILPVLIAALLAIGMVPSVNAPAYAVASNGDTILAFTSDAHNEPEGSNEVSASRVVRWIDQVNTDFGDASHDGIDFLTFCGDMGRSGEETQSDTGHGISSPDDYWTWTQAVITAADNKLGSSKTAYTTGNHEYKDGNFGSSTNPATNYFKVDTRVKSGSNYEIYCMGSRSAAQSYTDDQIELLKADLAGTTRKTVFIATHYPLHQYSSRTTTNAAKVIEAINQAVADKGIDVVFIWGHNHSQKDPYYNEVFRPGDEIKTSSNTNKQISFYYVPAGCMSDSENRSGGDITPKGLICRLPSSGEGSLIFYKLDNSSNLTQYKTSALGLRYRVTYNPNGASGTVTDSGEYKKNATVTVLGAGSLTKTGYTFASWKDETANKTYSPGNTFTITANTTLTAQWKKIDPFKAAKEAALKEIDDSTKGRLSLYDGKKQLDVLSLASEYKNLLTGAVSISKIDALMDEFRTKLAAIPTIADIEANKKLAEKVSDTKVTIKSAKAGKKKITVKWTSNKSCFDSYEVKCRLKGKTWKTYKVKGGAKTSLIIKSLKKGKKYQVRVRGCKTVDGTIVRGKYSKTLTVKVKYR